MRAAVFVDAGYLYTGGSIVLTGTRQNREVMELSHQEVISQLKMVVQEQDMGLSLLRIYWYDGLLGGRRSQEQERLATADDVKLRLGTVTGGRQKGVDSLIVTDLIELARNHAISDAVLLSGDEDLRIGVQIAQSFGVRVHLIGIEPSHRNQSNLLQEEADTTREWGKQDIENVLSVRQDMVIALNQEQDSSDAITDTSIDILENVAEEIANSIESSALNALALDQLSPFIPHEYDARLLSESGRRLGRDLEQSEKQQIRKLFREQIQQKAQEP